VTEASGSGALTRVATRLPRKLRYLPGVTRLPLPSISFSERELWQQRVESEVPVRQNIGCYTPMELPPGDLAMIITPERATLKAQERFEHLLGLVRQASQDGQRIDTVERDLMRQLLALGHDLLTAFVAHQGDGDRGPEVETTDGPIVRRLPQRHDRRYVSIFGELTITRVVYGTRDGNERVSGALPEWH
jgi:hypothetical protein